MTPIQKLSSYFNHKSQFEREFANFGFRFNNSLKQELKDLKKSNEFDKELINKYIFIQSEMYFFKSVQQNLGEFEQELNYKVNVVGQNDLKSEFIFSNIQKLIDLKKQIELISQKYPEKNIKKSLDRYELYCHYVGNKNKEPSDIRTSDDILQEIVNMGKEILPVPKNVLFNFYDFEYSDVYISFFIKTSKEITYSIQRIISENNQILDEKYDVLDSLPFLKLKEETQTISKEKLKIDQIALKYFYEGIQITRANGNEIAKINGHNSGEKLFQRYTYYSTTTNRKGKPTPCTAKKLKNKIELIESVIELLPTDKQGKAKDDFLILKTILDAEYE